MYNRTHRIALDSIRVVVDDDKVLAGQVILRHEELEKLEKQLRKTHTKRLNNGECTAQAGINYVDYPHITHVSQTMRLILLKSCIEGDFNRERRKFWAFLI